MHRISFFAFIIGVGALRTAAADITLTPMGRFQFSAKTSSASELSGISYVSGNTFYAISDADSRLYSLHVTLSPTGVISAATIDPTSLQMSDASGTAYASKATDFEGVAYNPTHNSVFVSDEIGPKIHEQSLATGSEINQANPNTAAELSVYRNIVTNAGFESMARSGDGNTLWTANQEPLNGDGSAATLTTHGTIRLQKLDGSLNPIVQYAYSLDINDAESGWTAMSTSCVSDMLVMPGGQVIMLERAKGTYAPGGTNSSTLHGNAADMRVRLYEIDPSGATDLAGGTLSNPTYVGKTLLWENFFDATLNNQFEGITLGPTLANGDPSVIMVADNGGGTTHALFSFDASLPEPSALALIGIPMILTGRRRRAKPGP